MKTHIIEVSGMSCGHCVSAVTNIIKELEDVNSVNVSLEKKNAEINCNDLLDRETIIEHINKTNIYQAK